MNTITALTIVIGVAVLILLVEFIRQVYNVKHGRTEVSRWRVLINRFLVLVVVVSLGWMGVTAYAAHRNHPLPAPAKQATSSSHHEDRLTLTVQTKARLNAAGEAQVKITVSAGARVEVRSADTTDMFDHFTAAKDHRTTKVVTLNYAGGYEVVATKGHQKVTKRITVAPGDSAVDQTSRTISSSSTSAVSRASSSTTGAGQGAANQAPTGPAYQGGGTATSRAGAGYGGSRPSAPVTTTPSHQPSAPIAGGAGNSTGAATGGQ